MDDIEIHVLAEQIRSLSDRIDEGFKSLKEMLSEHKNELKDHIKEDDGKFAKMEEEIQDLRINQTKMETQWKFIMAGVGGASGLLHILQFLSK